MILSAFHVKFQMGYLPGPADPQQQIKQILTPVYKMQQEMGSAPARPPEREVQGAAAPRETKKGRSGGQRPPGSALVDATACRVRVRGCVLRCGG